VDPLVCSNGDDRPKLEQGVRRSLVNPCPQLRRYKIQSMSRSCFVYSIIFILTWLHRSPHTSHDTRTVTDAMSTSILNTLNQLRVSAGKALEILTDQSDATFQDRAKRWTDIDRKTPAAIILPTNEEDIRKTVCLMHRILHHC
jgi:hypothetical protein